MEKFDLSLWLQDKSRKVVTRDGRPVRIVCYDAPTKNPIYGFVEGDDGITSWRKDGRFSNLIDNVDLFFADEEEELTEFEKELIEFRNKTPLISVHYYEKEGKELIHNYAQKLLDLARKELQPEFDKEMDKMLAETDKVVYQKGREDALKDLPKWKKATECKEFEVHVCVMDEDMYPYLDTEVHKGEYYLELNDLKTLPKE